MEELLSKSEKKRRSKAVELLVEELAGLTDRDLAALPCTEELRLELAATRKLKGGSRKRQIKYMAKMLRMTDHDELFSFLQEHKGSHLKRNREFHELEHLRDAIINEAIDICAQELQDGENWDEPDWESVAVRLAIQNFPDVDAAELKKAAWYFARTRKLQYSREIFRMLRAAMERQQVREAKDKDSGQRG